MEEKTGRPIRPQYCHSLKRKEKVTKHPNNHITKSNETSRQNKELCSKERDYSWFEIRVFLYWFWNCFLYRFFQFMIFINRIKKKKGGGLVIRTEWSEFVFLGGGKIEIIYMSRLVAVDIRAFCKIVILYMCIIKLFTWNHYTYILPPIPT